MIFNFLLDFLDGSSTQGVAVISWDIIGILLPMDDVNGSTFLFLIPSFVHLWFYASRIKGCVVARISHYIFLHIFPYFQYLPMIYSRLNQFWITDLRYESQIWNMNPRSEIWYDIFSMLLARELKQYFQVPNNTFNNQ